MKSEDWSEHSWPQCHPVTSPRHRTPVINHRCTSVSTSCSCFTGHRRATSPTTNLCRHGGAGDNIFHAMSACARLSHDGRDTASTAMQVATADDMTRHPAGGPVFYLGAFLCTYTRVCHSAVKRNIYSTGLLQPTRGFSCTAAAAAAAAATAAGLLSLPALQPWSRTYKLQRARAPGNTAKTHRHRRRSNRLRDIAKKHNRSASHSSYMTTKVSHSRAGCPSVIAHCVCASFRRVALNDRQFHTIHVFVNELIVAFITN